MVRMHAVRDVVDDNKYHDIEDTEEHQEDSAAVNEADELQEQAGHPGEGDQQELEGLASVTEEEEEEPLLGSQYSSEGEEYLLKQYEDYGYSDGDDCNVVRMHTMSNILIEEEDGDSDSSLSLLVEVSDSDSGNDSNVEGNVDVEDRESDDSFPLLVEVSDLELGYDTDDEDDVGAEEWFLAINGENPEAPSRRSGVFLRKSSRTLKRPVRTAAERRYMTTMLEINGLKAFTLFDSGCTAEMISIPPRCVTCSQNEKIDGRLG
ncbi:hypothetical protein LshimejAT787_1502340 [Lyophyllum shimeji]|uniref:Uncharacterized protein n=1 Tax=Lyophyllum shimeji TaxID=47721 RepID=A0A9P3UTV6_LYOSH|nr:hypothetical protein LshimejAT787_1502340 [Lyophyllum shimeji]